MPVLHCASCGDRLDFKKGGDIWTVRCTGCGFEIMVDGRKKDLFDAYEEFSKAVKDAGAGTKKGPSAGATRKRRAVQSEGAEEGGRRKPSVPQVQSQKEIQQIVTNGGASLQDLPAAIKRMITAGRDYLVTYRRMNPTDADYGCAVDDLKLPARLKSHLASKGIERLYRHQEEAFRLIQEGKDVVIAAPTAQGKTEGFVLPIIRQLLTDIQDTLTNTGVRALLVYPTKALARDQFDKIRDMCETSGLRAGLFDGDIPASQRNGIYENPPDVLLTNPDILHYHLGWDQSRLIPILRTVKFVVVDEIHLYTGSMGTNVYYILKRLELEAGRLQMIGASATVSNPKEFAEQLFDREVALVHSESAKRGPIHFMMYYPGNRSKYGMIVDLAGMLQKGGFKTLVFGNTHSEAEVLNLLLREQGYKSMVHRAGLTKVYRNDVESQFKSGQLPMIVSTPTLELGIDIGDLDSVVSMLVSVTRLTQRIGRAGRKGQESVAILALRENDPISSFYRHLPQKYFTDIDAAYMEPENEVVGYYQLIAAAMSGKLNKSTFPRQAKILERLQTDGLISVEASGHVRIANYTAARKLWRDYSIRGIGDTVQIKSGEKLLGERSMPMAAQELHPGAIYLHGGRNYLSVDFRSTPGLGRATVVSFDDRSVHTKPLYSTMPRIIENHESRRVLGLKITYCTLEMTQTVEGYVKKETKSGRTLSRMPLDEPLVYRYLTRGFVFRAPAPTKTVNAYLGGTLKNAEGPKLDPAELYGGAFHAFEHVLIESSDMLTGGGTREIGGVSMGDSGVIFVYDGSPGGNGASKLLFTKLEEAFSRAETILSQCDCHTVDGCPLCTYSYQCGNNNKPLFKLGALDSIQQILSKAETAVDEENYLSYQPLV